METLKDSTRAENPYLKSNFISRFFFWYMNSIFVKGYKGELNKKDIHKITHHDSAIVQAEKLERLWSDELQKNGDKPSLFKVIVKFGRFQLFCCFLEHSTTEACKICQAIFLGKLLEGFVNGSFDNTQFYWATIITGSMLLHWSLIHPMSYMIEKHGVNAKSAILAMIFKKAFRLSEAKLRSISTGHIVTIISSDARKIQDSYKLSPYIVVGPMELIVVAVILYYEIGAACFAGIGVLLLGTPMQIYMGSYFAKMRSKSVLKTDERINVMNEIISSMQVTKMYAWQESFAQLIHNIRRKESKYVMKSNLARAYNNGIFRSTTYIVLLATFAVYYFSGNTMTLPTTFLIMNLFLTLRWSFLFFLPLVVQLVSECYVSSKRIQKFLLEDEMELSIKASPKKTSTSHASMVKFTDVCADWDNETSDPMINKLSFTVNSRKPLLMIVGPVGSGKTSILMTVMKELKLLSGDITTSGTTAYVSQEAWIFSGSVKQNILFGQPYDKDTYQQVIAACCLTMDLQSFEKGDKTLVGERGVSLSGGQKARISLARAVYQNADIYLLDDPLSAVDAKTGKHLFEHCIRGLLKKKLVLLVTHQIQYLEHANDIICLQEEGQMMRGSLHNLSRHGVDIVNILRPESQEKQWDQDSAIDTEDNLDSTNRSLARISISFSKDTKDSPIKSVKSITSLDNLARETEEEDEYIEQGAIPLKSYVKYFTQGVGWIMFSLLITSQFVAQITLTFTDYWIGRWAESESQRTNNQTITSNMYFLTNPDYNLYIFAALVTLAALFNFFRAMYFFYVMVKCSRQLHNTMFKAVLNAPLYFFNTNPVGQILNRFSRDIYSMDDELPWSFNDFVQFGLLSLAIIIINCISVPYLAVLVLPLLIIFVLARQSYMRTSRQLKRLEAVSRSPLYTHISSTLAGMTTIRSFDLQKKILTEFYACIDYQTEAWITFLTASRWFGQRLDFVAVFFSTCALYAPIIVARYSSDVNTSLIGVSLTYALQLCGLFQWCIRQSAEVDNMMTSVERVFEYSQLESEPDNGDNKELRKTWPEYGLITAESCSFSYHESLPYVLKKLFFCIKPKDKVGIVGRTGAGKSSLISMMLRLGNMTGTIRIDGYDISMLSLKELRRNVSVIPQDPVLFSGTLRKNLDPFNEYKDGDIWEALEEVQMKDAVMDFPSKLSNEITESGSNLSVGERQLLCLARALLRQNKILMIDEATANVDTETDVLIQRTLREKFKDCTVLTIAHRLNTIMDSDRVMVIESGRIVEFDEPIELLQNASGYFRKLVDQAGRNEANRLESLAEEAKQLRKLSDMQQELSYPGCQIQKSKSKEELVKMFGKNLVFETTV